ncbi:hypothetical protein PUNSTDRAFT_136712 [Punctularia strigosozonata HHB-11173 SS5]|uniref:uncharacterized protein n=1 Tax=Punctularia strigosozonata (strain HHB-11173) TaxID=741275 RepID=UPI00044184D0|nr:uncharacterized protein PUNSTDRAFT_136712 [Punctularia strigosozonata HHB-11173 SS5]EIN06893.1 hypothetical protein PUNSTDRAFT_136712 [Punctularia strigosozonata HHB-11173 SS5]
MAALLLLNETTVANRSSGDLSLHNVGGWSSTFIQRDSQTVVTGRKDWILQRGFVYRFSGEISTNPGDIVSIVQDGKALTLHVLRLDGKVENFTTLDGERPPQGLTAESTEDPAPNVIVTSEALAKVVFTSSLSGGLSRLSLTDKDAGDQHAQIDNYKRSIDGLLYRHTVTTIEIAAVISKTFNLGPLDITIAFDTDKLEGSVTASILGISLGTAKFSPSQGARLGIDVYLAKASVVITIHDNGVYLEAHASTIFNGSADFGPTEIIHF